MPWRTYSAPTPLGPSNLWAPSETRSAPSAATSRSTYGAAWTASTWSRTPRCGPDPRGDLVDRLDRADLVVGEHDRDEDRPVGERRLELVGVHPPVAVDRQLDDLEPELLEVAQRVADRVMLDRRGHDPMAARLAGPGRALEGEVVGLRPADVKTISRASAPSRRGDAARAPRPGRRGPPGRTRGPTTGCRRTSVRYGSIASRTSRRSGVVAAWSR